MTFFVLGAHPTLSLAEIAAVAGRGFSFARASREILLLDEDDLHLQELNDRLSGVVKVGRTFAHLSEWDPAAAADTIAGAIIGAHAGGSGAQAHPQGA
jgi:hypothetical protein